MLSIILFVFVCLILYLWWQWNIKDLGSIPLHPGGLPILGNAHQFLGSSIKLWDFLKELSYFSLKSGGVSALYLGPFNRVYMLTDPDDCLTVSNECLDKPFLYDIAREWTATGLISADVSTWKPHRKILNPVFSQQKMNEYIEIFNSHAKRLVHNLSVELGTGKFNTRPYIMSYTQESICQILLGLEEDFAKKIKEYGEAVDKLLSVFIAKAQRIWLHIPFFFERSEYKKKLDESIVVTSNIINDIIQRKKTDIKRNEQEQITKQEPEPVYEMLLKLQGTSDSLSDKEIREHLETIIFTGFDSVTESMIFALKLIGENQGVQQRLYEELQEVLGADTNVVVNRYDLVKLVYLDAVVKEILRVSSTVPMVARKILKDVKLKNHTIKANSIVGLSPFGIHRHPMWGPDVEEFRPERWLEPNCPAITSPNLFAAFSLGKRNCIGKLYAMLTLKTTLAHLLRQYRVLADDSKMIIKFDIAVRPLAGHEISLERR